MNVVRSLWVHRWVSPVLGASLVLALAAAGPAAAQTSLLRQANVALLRGYPVARMAAGDFDGDGLNDVAGITYVAFPDEYTQEKVLIQRQLAGGAPSFAEAQALPARAPQDLLVADLDADGDADLAVVQDDASDALAIWINQGGRQGGTPGRFGRLPLTLAYDVATQVAAVDVDANPATPPWLLLVRGLGRDSLLFGNQLDLAAPALTLQQSLGHTSAVGVAVADIDASGYADLLIYGDGCRLWTHQGAVSAALCGAAAGLLRSDRDGFRGGDASHRTEHRAIRRGAGHRKRRQLDRGHHAPGVG
jgi:hypothetical protein